MGECFCLNGKSKVTIDHAKVDLRKIDSPYEGAGSVFVLNKKAGAALIVLIFLGCEAFGEPRKINNFQKKYNLVLLSMDNIRADHMSLYGYKKPTTPNLEKWAAKAQVFNNFYSTTSMTVTSEGSVFTGRYPFENGVISFDHEFSPNIETITSILAKNGYATMGWGDSPEYSGFPKMQKSFSRHFNNFFMPRFRFTKVGEKRSREFNIKPIDKFLESNSYNNFFIWVPLGVAHSPHGYLLEKKFTDVNYRGPLEILRDFNGGNLWTYKNILYPVTEKTNFIFANENGRLLKRSAKVPIKLKGPDIQWLIDRYDDGIYAADREFQKIIDLLEKRKRLDDTIIVFYSNHGEELNEHGYFGHYDVYQGNVRVPLIIYSPKHFIPGRPETLASSVDILPTVLAEMGIQQPPEVDGIDLFSPLAKKRNEIFLLRTPLWESIIRIENQKSKWDDFRNGKIQAKNIMDPVVVNSQFKLIRRKSRFILKEYSIFGAVSGKKIVYPEYELYDLKNDPLEKNNLAAKLSEFESLHLKLLNFEKRITSKKFEVQQPNPVIQDYQ